MDSRVKQISLRSMLILALFGALLGLLVTTNSPSAPALAEPVVQEAPTVRIDYPEKGALITADAGTVLPISGVAWDSLNDPGFPTDPVLNAIGNPSHLGTYYVTWFPVPGALNYVLTESTSPYFDANIVTYPNAVSPQFITGKANGTYYYRLQAFNTNGPSRWSNVVSTVVGHGVLAEPIAPQLDLPVIEVSINGGAWQAATVAQHPSGYWTWSLNWTLPEEDEAVYTIRARGQIGGDLGAVDEISVTVRNQRSIIYMPLIMRRWPPVPYAPVLNEISNADLDGNYTVSWAYNGPYDVPVPTSYTLQESTSADFSTALQETIVAASTYAVNITSKGSGTYHYRVRGNNVNGNGEWSNVRSVMVVSGFSDDFSNPASGWARATYKRSDGGDLMNVDYVDGTYRMKIFLATADQNNHKMGLAKAPYNNTNTSYDVAVTHFFAQAEMPFPDYKPLEGKAGLVFGANADFTSFYVFEWNWNGVCAVNRYTSFTWPVSGYQGFGGSMVTTPIRDWGTCTNLLANNYNQANRLLVEVRDNRATVFVHNNNVKTQIFAFTDDALRNHRQVGLITGSWFWTPIESRFDNFKLETR